MRHVIASLIFVLSMGSVWAQEGQQFNHKVWCFEQRAVMEVLARDFKETPIFHGESEAVQYVLYTNDKTGGWTMIGYQDGMGCIMGAGKKHTQFFGTAI